MLLHHPKGHDQEVGSLPLVRQIAIAMGGWYGAERSGVEQLRDSDLQGAHAFSLSLTRSTFPYDSDGAFATPSTIRAVI